LQLVTAVVNPAEYAAIDPLSSCPCLMSSAHPTKQCFKDHITNHLVTSDYLKDDKHSYDKALCLIRNELLLAFIQATQSQQCQKLEK